MKSMKEIDMQVGSLRSTAVGVAAVNRAFEAGALCVSMRECYMPSNERRSRGALAARDSL